MDDTDVTGDFRSQFLVEKCAFEFRSIDFGRSDTIGWNEHLCVFCDLIGSRRWKRVRHFLCMKTIPFTRQANSCELNGLVKSLRCRLRKGRGCAPNTTAKPRRALQIHRAAVRVRNLLFLERDPNWNGHVCFLRKRFVTADLRGLQAPVLLFCFNRERQTAKEM